MVMCLWTAGVSDDNSKEQSNIHKYFKPMSSASKHMLASVNVSTEYYPTDYAKNNTEIRLCQKRLDCPDSGCHHQQNDCVILKHETQTEMKYFL